MFRNIAILCLSVVAAAGVTAAKADTIGPGCASCFGSTYTLSETATSNPNVFDVTLVVNTSGYTGTSTNLLNAVALKIVPNTSDLSLVAMLAPAPTGFGPVLFSTLNANGCTGGANSGYFCSPSSTLGLPVGPGDIYTFRWAVTVNNPSALLTGFDAASVKALYVTSTGQQNGITSEDITLSSTNTPVPEPGTLALLGTGLAGFAFVGRRFIA